MRIESITLRGFKGVTETFSLDRLNLLVGPNGSGKSAVTQAIQWAVTGRTDLGAKNDDTALLAGAIGCAVGIYLDDGFTWTRELLIDRHENKIAQQLTVLGKRVSLRDGDAGIHEHVGNFAPMFRLGEFVGLSPDKQRTEIVRLCGAAAENTERDDGGLVWQLFRRTALALIGEGTVAAILDAGGAWPELAKKLGEDVAHEVVDIQENTVAPELHDTSIESVSRALEAVTGVVNDSRRESERGHAAAQQLAGRKVELQVASETVTALKQQLTKIRAQREDLVLQTGHQKGRLAAKSVMVRGVEQMVADIEELVEPPAVPEGDADELDRRAAEIEAEPEPFGLSEELRARARKALVDANNAWPTMNAANSSVINAAGLLADARRRLDAARKEAAQSCWPAAKRFWELIEPAVDNSDDAVIVAMIDFGCLIAGQVGDLDDQVEPHERLVAQAQKEADEAVAAQKVVVRAKAEADQALGEIEAEVDDLEKEYDQALQRHLVRTNDTQALRRQADDIRTAQRLADEATIKRGRLDTDLLENQRRLDEFLADGGWVPVDQLEQQKTASNAAIVQIERKIDDRQVADRVDEEYRRAIADAERQGVRHDAAKAVASAIRDERETMMNDLVAPLVGQMQAVLTKAAPKREPYCRLQNDRGKPIFELGWTVDGERRVSFSAMSGGERATFGAALAHALIAMADPPLKLMMIEAGECDIDSFLSLAAGVREVEVGNVLIMSWQSAFVLDEWNVIDFAAEVAEVAA